MNLYDARKRQSRNLFGGMRCQLLVAMACIGNPDILILDEPTTALNPVSQKKVGVAIFIDYWQNYVALRVLVGVIHYCLSLFFLCVLVGVGGDRESEARS